MFPFLMQSVKWNYAERQCYFITAFQILDVAIPHPTRLTPGHLPPRGKAFLFDNSLTNVPKHSIISLIG